MALGPIELVVLGFPGSRFTGQIRPRIQELVDRNIVNVVDALLVKKDEQGDVTFFELEELAAGDPDIQALGTYMSGQLDLFSDEDAEAFAADLEPGSSALAIAFEHTWMKPVRDAIVDSGGVLIADIHVPAAAVDQVLDAVEQLKSSSGRGRIPHANA